MAALLRVHVLMGNTETNLANGKAGDYSLYGGINDARFIILPYDLDSVLLASGSPDSALFASTAFTSISRFLLHPEITPRYFAVLREMMDSVFSPAEISVTLDDVLGKNVPQADIDTMKQVVANRIATSRRTFPPTLPPPARCRSPTITRPPPIRPPT